MRFPSSDAELLAAFPPILRQLIEAELAAGNSIVEIASCFPAPPAGAYVKLARPLSTRPRKSGDGIDYYDRNGSSYSGEITDSKRYFFVLEPPRPPEPEPDMDAIRADLEARQRAADNARYAAQEEEYIRRQQAARPEVPATSPSPRQPLSLVDRFRASMVMDLDKWRDGIGYDLSLLKAATPTDLASIEDILVHRAIDDWRDVEALAALDTPRTRACLRKVVQHGRGDLAEAVTRHAPQLVDKEERTHVLVEVLEHGEFYGGLTQALAQVRTFHPPLVVDALLRGLLSRAGMSGAVHFAAMLLYIHGKAATDFDWEQRPYFLRFGTEDRVERERLFRDLCGKIGVDPEPYVRVQDLPSTP